MNKKLLLSITIISTIFTLSTVHASPANKPATKTAAPQIQKNPPKTTAQTEDEKYAQVYEKCTKESEGNEAKYDQLFNLCMEKNGFPQEEYETGGQPMQSIEGQDN